MSIRRRDFLKSAALLAVPGIPWVGFADTCTDDSSLMNVGDQRQLFFDDLLIESVQDITREIHQPYKYEGNPLIVKDKPWEHVVQFRSSGYTVLRDPKDKLFKAWYTDEGFTNENLRQRATWPPYRGLYAYSEDGIHWVKPPLGLYWENGQDTNIFWGDPHPQSGGADSRNIILDLSESDESKRFKSIYFQAPEGKPEESRIELAYSADGLHWKRYDEQPSFGKLGAHLDDMSLLGYDPERRLYILTTRHPRMIDIAVNPRLPVSKRRFFQPHYPRDFSRMNKRRIYQCESKDLVHWNEPTLILAPSEDDNLDDSLYGMVQFRVGDTRIGLLDVLHEVSNVIEVQLAYSLDGRCWKRVHKPWLTSGPAGSWDQIMVETTNDPIEVGDEWWFYYGGSGFGHHDWYITGFLDELDVPEARDVSKVGFFLGLAKLRLDGFCSLNAGPVREGILVSRPMASEGTGLWMNAECGPGGYIDVEVLSQADEKLVLGYSRKDFDRFTGNSVRHQLSWKSRRKVSPEPFRRLVFYMRNAKLYSFHFSA